MERFLEAAENGDPALSSASWYNLGNALYRQQQLQESLEAYKQALRANPADLDAKHNLERVLEQLQEQEQQRTQERAGINPGPEPEDQETGPGPAGPQTGPGGPGRATGTGRGRPESRKEQNPQEQGHPEDQQQEPQPQPGEMTPEEAERLLNAIREDPGDVNRKRAPATGKRPRKKW